MTQEKAVNTKKGRKKNQAEKANSPLNQKARVIKRIQGFEHQWIGGPTRIISWPKQLNQTVLTMCLWREGVK